MEKLLRRLRTYFTKFPKGPMSPSYSELRKAALKEQKLLNESSSPQAKEQHKKKLEKILTDVDTLFTDWVQSHSSHAATDPHPK